MPTDLPTAGARADPDEVGDLLDAVHERWGFDFRGYTRPSVERRIRRLVTSERVRSVYDLRTKLVTDPEAMERFLLALSISVTSLFRDPGFYRVARSHVVPILRSYPFVRIWSAGCSTGEEVYSLAIVLAEEGLLERSRIYATDMNDAVLERASSGVFPLGSMKEYTENYIAAGGTAALSDYYTAGYGGAVMDRSLQRQIVWSQHNLVTDGVFNEFHLILCRNVLIYFDDDLQRRALHLLHESLSLFGVIGLGRAETIHHSPDVASYQTIDATEKVYRRVT